MAIKTVQSLDPADVIPPDSAKPRPILAWAWVGAAILCIEIYTVSRWIISKPTRTPSGPTPVPGYMEWPAHIWEIAGVFAAIAVYWYFLVKPWREERRITLDGLLVIVFSLQLWQDAFMNLVQPVSFYNATFFNLGVWNGYLPGWLAQNGTRAPEPLVWAGAAYIYICFGASVAACYFMRRVKARWPRIKPVGLIAVCVVAVFVFDCVLEPPFLLLGFYHYGGAPGWMTLFHGHYYQFPIIEPLTMGVVWTGWASVRYFRDDKGHSLIERGHDKLGFQGKRKTFVRFLALYAAINIVFSVGYVLPWNILGLHAGEWPKDITERSYFTGRVCGPETDYACPGPNVPIPRPGSGHLRPDGSFAHTSP